MKKLKKHKTTTKVAIFAGAAALMAWTPKIHAQSAVDDLLNKLEQKGILTSDEAQHLKDEQKKDTTENFNKAFNSKFPMPDWISSYKLYGDFRGRFDDISWSDPAAANNNNIRLRYRVRVGFTANMKDNLQVGFRLGSGDSGGNPLSNNTTMENNATKKPIWVDEAYGRWTPIHDDTWTVAGTIGKMPNDYPFQVTPMVLDPDYTPEGGAVRTVYHINDQNALTFNGAAFVLDQLNSRGPFLYGGQALWNAHWTPQIDTSLGVAALNIVDKQNLGNGAVPNNNSGNTRNAAGNLVANFNPIVVDASATYKLDHFPLYTGAFPIKLAGEFIYNPGASSSNNKGYWAGVTFGKAGKKHQWDVSYRYEYLQGDAWYEELVNDDNVGYYSAPLPNSGKTGAAGGTNVKGHLVKFDYAIFDSLTFTFTCYINNLIHNPGPTSSSAIHAMADLMWKF